MMLFKRLCLLTILIVSFAATSLFAQSSTNGGAKAAFLPLLINESHRSAISALVVDNSADLLASAAEDGSIKLYRDKGRRLIQSIQAGLYPVIKLALGQENRLAAVERQPAGFYRLSVWNYQTGLLLYTVVLHDQVLSLAFSPRSNYLLCTLARWNSVIFLDLQHGSFRDWLTEGFGLVDFALMSTREDRLMSYQATSGDLVYHDLDSGTELKRLSTKPLLQGLQLLPDGTKTRAVAIDNGNPVSVDLVSGMVVAGKSPGFPLIQLLTDEVNPSHLLAIGGNSGNLRLASCTIDINGLIVPESTDKTAARLSGSSACLIAGELCLGDPNGQLIMVGPGDKQTALSERRTIPIGAIAFSSQGLYLSTSMGTIKVTTDLFQPTQGVLTLGRFDQNQVAAIPPNSSLYTMSDHEILFWDQGRNPKLNRFDTRKEVVSRTSPPGTGTIIHLGVQNDQISIVDSLGNIRLSNLPDLKQSAQFSAQGAFTASLTGDGKVLVGQGASGSNSRSLQRITIKTGENIPLASTASAIFQLSYSPVTKRLFGLSMSSADGKPVTVLQQGNSDELLDPVVSLPGEDLGAEIVASGDGRHLYTSLGGISVGVWDGKRFDNFESSTHAPRRLAVFQNFLAAINSDGSVTLYDALRHTVLLDIWVSLGGTAFYLTGDQTIGIANRIQGGKILPTDSKEKQIILNSLSRMESDDTNASVPFNPVMDMLPRIFY